MQSSKLLTSNDIANYLKISLVTGCQIYSGNRFAFWMYLLTDKRICCKILHFSQDTCSGNKLALFYNVSFHNNTTRSVEIHAMQPLQRFALVSCHWLPYIFWEQVCIVLVLNNTLGCRETNVQCTKTCKNVQKYAPHSGAVGVLSPVAKYAARSVSQPSIHVYPELYVKILHKTHKFFGFTVLYTWQISTPS